MINFRTIPWLITPRRWQPEFTAAFRHHYEIYGTPAIGSVIMGAGKSKAIAQVLREVVIPVNQNVVVTTDGVELTNDLYREFTAALSPLDISVGRYYGGIKRPGTVTVVCNDSLESYAKINKKECHLLIADEADTTECETYLRGYGALHPHHTAGVTATAYRANKKINLSLFEEALGPHKPCFYRYGLNAARQDGGVLCDWKLVPWTGPDDIPFDEVCLRMIIETGDEAFPLLCNARDKADADQFAAFLNANGIPAAVVYSGIKEDEIRRRFSMLEHGALNAIVHVNKVARGSNYPFLRTMLMRRNVMSRNRFFQEIGRMLRWHPSKDKAVLLDPLDCFGRFKMSYAEALGQNDCDDEREEKKRVDAISKELNSDNKVVALSALEAAIRVLTVACDLSSPSADVYLPMKARRSAVLPEQIDSINQLARQVLIMKDTHDVWRNIISMFTEVNTRGMADDAIYCLQHIVTKGWPDIDEYGCIRRPKAGQLFCNEKRREIYAK